MNILKYNVFFIAKLMTRLLSTESRHSDSKEKHRLQFLTAVPPLILRFDDDLALRLTTRGFFLQIKKYISNLAIVQQRLLR